MTKKLDVVGNGFIFIKDLPPTGNGRKSIFICPKCNNEVEMFHRFTKRNKSCGCNRIRTGKDIYNYINLDKFEPIGDYGLLFIKDLPIKNKLRFVLAQCSCGKLFESYLTPLRRNQTRSCGCFNHNNNTFGNMINSKNEFLYSRWQGMKQRCFNKSNNKYKDYGGRGITVYNLWINNFQMYYDYMSALPKFDKALDDGLTIDRINNDKNYEPGNLRWATIQEQNLNRRI